MQKLFIALFVLSPIYSIAQKTSVIEKLKSYNIDSSALINMSSKAFKDEYAFDINTTSVVADKQKMLLPATMHPNQKISGRLNRLTGMNHQAQIKMLF